MKLIMLGTGNALVTKCYNTCFVMQEEGQSLLVDGGGGGALLVQLEKAGIKPTELRTIFVTHKHIDHLLGIIWMLRVISQAMSKGKMQGEVTLYAHEEVIGILQRMAQELLTTKQAACIGKTLHLVTVEDGEQRELLGHKTTFFDIHSTKAKQFGFSMELADGRKLTCCGDEPFNPLNLPHVQGSNWLLHEAFCLYSQRDKFSPYEKHHSTVKEACELAEKLGVENLLLYHTEDENIARRQELYTAEGKQYYHGNLFVPNDLDVLTL